jgi:hypothetical protein
LTPAATRRRAADGAPDSTGASAVPEHKRELTTQERDFVRALNAVRAQAA